MLPPFLIMLREGIEAALITGIVATYLRQTGRSQWMPAVWIGVFLAVAMSLFVGTGLQLVSAEFPQKTQELFEALVGVVAVAVLVSMVFWMRKAARSIKSELHDSIDAALAKHSSGTWALIGIVFFAVAREGLESIFFLLAIFQQSTGPAAPIGALLGVAVAVCVGLAIYAGGVRLNLHRFFRWTGIFILFVAAGLLSSSVKHLHEAGIWNGLQTHAFDLSAVLPVSSLIGTILSGVFSYEEAPTVGEVIIYLGFLAATLTLFLWPMAPSREVLTHSTTQSDSHA
ncbi:iron uptake transporter permease EfeU [Acuticoccus mangrovi]|uniref:FTR1 family protein n=1 Tax=Acuticoccus mangrovi TaxID=2796142 RepID=A0A934IKS1_9HYPH|nr:iron uptake transporter permease EfeU [Acuticoccus mangrovi]MBJ3778459.1 FTR1 family protein [Acuticoccus mangrovi]